ncbi:FctA domain-containing protein [Arcanobacterium hippocoleae]
MKLHVRKSLIGILALVGVLIPSLGSAAYGQTYGQTSEPGGNSVILPAVEVSVPENANLDGVPAGVFTFELHAAPGTPLPENPQVRVSAAQDTHLKSALFAPITFTEVGEYHYTLQVVNPDAVSRWSIDPLSYALTVKVEDLQGTVSVTAHRAGSDEKATRIHFTAAPKMPDLPKDSSGLPKTGAALNTAIGAGVLLLGSGVLFAVIARRYFRGKNNSFRLD